MGPFRGKMFFVLIDSHSKWPEVFIMPSTTTTKTIEVLRQVFACYGFPEQLVSDNGPQFISKEFAVFLKLNGINTFEVYHTTHHQVMEWQRDLLKL